MAVLGTSWYLC